MRVALVVTGGVDPSGRDRVIPVLLTLIERLARQHTVVVYALRYFRTPTIYPLLGATVCDLGSPRGIRCQYGALVRAIRRDGRCDVIHGHWALPCGLAAGLAGRRLRIPVVVTLDSGEFVGLREIGYGAQLRLRQRLAVRLAYTLASEAIVCTEYQARLAGRLGMHPSIVPLGVDATRFTPAPRADGPPWRLLHVGSINPVKDHDTLLRTLELLRRRHLDVSLDVVGEDRRHGAVAQLAAQLGVAPYVRFHGVLASSALVPFYQRAHLLAVTSRHEAAGIVILEAASCGLPVVGSAVGHLADWAPRRATAVAPQDPAALADAIADLLASPARRAETAAAALEWTRAHDAEWSATELVSRYELAVTPPSPRQDAGP
jgi:glycosyltransferase involved in cell wall biosynthesis